jgi:YgiT-type zinc finger domain-containing protein
MKCLICKQGRPQPGLTKITLERGELSLVLNNVPALVCPICGEAYADEATTARLFETAREMEYSGMLVDVRPFEMKEPA